MPSSDAAQRRSESVVVAGPGGAGDAVGTLPQAVRRDFSAVGYDEAMRRAREIVLLGPIRIGATLCNALLRPR